MLNSVRARITAWNTVLFVFVVGSLAAGTYDYLRRDAYERLDDSTHTVLGVIKLAIVHEVEENGGIKDGERAVQQVLNTMYQSSFPQEQIAIWDGVRLVAYKGNLGRKQDDLRRFPATAQVSSFNEGDLRVAVDRVFVPTIKTTYTVAVSTWRGDTLNDLSALLHGLTIIIPLSLLLSAVGGYLLARRTLAPLTGIAQTVDEISSTSLDTRIEIINPKDEVGQLALRFNRLLDRLQEAFGQQRRFMADASHELRTPLSAALTATQVMLREEGRSAEEYREALQITEEQLRRLRRIVEDMFLLARADTASLDIRHEEFYLDELITESCRAMRLLAERNGIKLDLLKPLPEVRMWGDAGLIRQAIIILLDNACKYTGAGGLVSVSLEAQENHCTLRVFDTGPGIPEFARPHLFERFYRVDTSRSRLQTGANEGGSGAGLGLAIAQWIAEQHGSRIVLESSSSKGSAFAFHLSIPQQPHVTESTISRSTEKTEILHRSRSLQ